MIFWAWCFACGNEASKEVDSAHESTCEPIEYPIDPFIDAVVSFAPGDGAGFGSDQLPDIILGGPQGEGDDRGSLDVLTLGDGGSIIVEFQDWIPVDGPGVDILVFENPFEGWIEPGIVSASSDGEEWVAWDCMLQEPFTGCAGIQPVYAHAIENCWDATDPALAGGDGFDLSDINLPYVRFLKIEDAQYSGLGGFDLDAIAVVHGDVLP